MESKKIPLHFVELNNGQIPGLPRNPRCWSYNDIERLQKSIEETPELLEARGAVVYPYNGKYVTIGGNMRVTAVRHLGYESINCIVLPEDMPVEKLIEIAIKDNASFGRWDDELLKAEWSDCPLVEWGCDNYFQNGEGYEGGEERAGQTMDDNRKTFEIVLSPKEFNFVQDRLRMVDDVPEQALLKLMGYGKE